MVRSFFRKLMGAETMRDRLKPYLQKLELLYSANEGTARKLLSDVWKKKRHRIVNDHFNGDKDRMSNPTNEDFEEIAELLFQSWYSSEKSTMEDSEKEWGYGPEGFKDLYGALKRKKKKTKRKRDKSKSNNAPKSASKKKPSRKKPETKSKKKKQKKKRTKRRRR